MVEAKSNENKLIQTRCIPLFALIAILTIGIISREKYSVYGHKEHIL